MSSRDVTGEGVIRRAAHLAGANLSVGWRQHAAQWPAAVWLVGALVPEVMRMGVYVLIGYLVGGQQGMVYALIGCAVLAVMSSSLVHVTDIPVTDARSGVYHQVALGVLPPFVQYVIRAAPQAVCALLTATATITVLSTVMGSLELIVPLMTHLWLLLPAIVSAVMLGLFVIAPAVGGNYEHLTYNSATVVLTVFSGAIFATQHIPVIDTVGRVLPLRHTIEAMRLALEGQPYVAALGLECVVAAGWGLAAYGFYRWQDGRGRRSGRGAFAA